MSDIYTLIDKTSEDSPKKPKSWSIFVEHIELSCRNDFNEYFVDRLDFPTENVW